MICDRYIGVHCVDGSCPLANAVEYDERGIPLPDDCDDCCCRLGCDDCILDGDARCPLNQP